jgi:hypothetical protein
MKKWIVVLCLAVLVTGFGVLGALTKAPSPEKRTELASTDLSIYFSQAYFSGSFGGGRCDIACSDGSFFSVKSFSTSNCCQSCAELCGTTCVASGNGPSVLCGGL